MIRNSQLSIWSVQSIIGRWRSHHTVEPVAPSIKADGKETRQSINPQIVCESHRHSLLSGQSIAAAGTERRLPCSQDAVSQAHGLTWRAVRGAADGVRGGKRREGLASFPWAARGATALRACSGSTGLEQGAWRDITI